MAVRRYDEVVLTRDLKPDGKNEVWVTGTTAVVVEVVGDDEMILERAVNDPRLVGRLRFETAVARCSDVKTI
jgi:hypothetical protein